MFLFMSRMNNKQRLLKILVRSVERWSRKFEECVQRYCCFLLSGRSSEDLAREHYDQILILVMDKDRHAIGLYNIGARLEWFLAVRCMYLFSHAVLPEKLGRFIFSCLDFRLSSKAILIFLDTVTFIRIVELISFTQKCWFNNNKKRTELINNCLPWQITNRKRVSSQ